MNKPDAKDRVIHKLGIAVANLTIEKEMAIAQRDELAEYILQMEKEKEVIDDGTSEEQHPERPTESPE